MHRLVGALGAFLYAQSLCTFPQEMGYVVWGIYHPLDRGQGELLGYSIAQALLNDSLVREITYIHSISHTLERLGPWIVIRGAATPEGLYAFFTALRGALERFPQQLQVGIPFHLSNQPFSDFFRWVYEDTSVIEKTPIAISRAFYSYWREGRLSVFMRGKVPSPLLRAARLLVEGEPIPYEYIPPEAPPATRPLPRQGAGVLYVRWKLKGMPTLESQIALWAHSRALLHHLCEEKQLACQASWIPLPHGLELWIETGLPVAARQAVEDFLQRPFRPSPTAPAQFFTWAHAQENLFLSSWWNCVWNLPTFPKAPSTISPRLLSKAIRNYSVIAFVIAE